MAIAPADTAPILVNLLESDTSFAVLAKPAKLKSCPKSHTHLITLFGDVAPAGLFPESCNRQSVVVAKR